MMMKILRFFKWFMRQMAELHGAWQMVLMVRYISWIFNANIFSSWVFPTGRHLINFDVRNISNIDLTFSRLNYLNGAKMCELCEPWTVGELCELENLPWMAYPQVNNYYCFKDDCIIIIFILNDYIIYLLLWYNNIFKF